MVASNMFWNASANSHGVKNPHGVHIESTRSCLKRHISLPKKTHVINTESPYHHKSHRVSVKYHVMLFADENIY